VAVLARYHAQMLRPRFESQFQPEGVMFRTDRSCGVIPVRGHGACARFLLVLSRKGHWAFPKGHADPGETDQQAALRELREETGISRVSLLPGRRFQEQYDFADKQGRPVHKTVVYFLGFVRHVQPIRLQAQEIADFRWCDSQEALELITFPECRGMFRSVLAFLQQYES